MILYFLLLVLLYFCFAYRKKTTLFCAFLLVKLIQFINLPVAFPVL
jgi:hypothetical protein